MRQLHLKRKVAICPKAVWAEIFCDGTFGCVRMTLDCSAKQAKPKRCGMT